jgi:hypothetical protein
VPVNQKQIFFESGAETFYAAVKLSMILSARLHPARPLDRLVHIVGNGSGGTGCWLRVTG